VAPSGWRYQIRGGQPGPAAHEAICSQVPLKRLGRAADIAETAPFLLSPRSSYVTARGVAVNGDPVAAIAAS
jgi:NAD(P)-dependent dehydrogenase (short-subunit alcohol dehydrogenase family)